MIILPLSMLRTKHHYNAMAKMAGEISVAAAAVLHSLHFAVHICCIAHIEHVFCQILGDLSVACVRVPSLRSVFGQY